MTSASAASGRWPPSPAWSPTSASGMSKEQMRTEGPAWARRLRVEDVRGRRQRRRPHPPRLIRRLGGDAGAADLVARRPRGRALHPQPGRVVRGRGPRGSRTDRGQVQVQLHRLGGGAAGERPRNRRRERRPDGQPGKRSAKRAAGGEGGDRGGQLDLHHRLRLGRRPQLLVLLRLRLLRRGQLRRSTAPACSTPRSSPARSKATASRARASGSRSTPAPTHTYAVIAGLRWDTVGNAAGEGPRWHAEPPLSGRLRRAASDRVLSRSSAVRCR